MLSLKFHNIADYIIAVLLIASPFVIGFADINAARNVFLILGFGLAAYSLITKYYYCIARILPIGIHMIFDVMAGIVVMLSPFVFAYNQELSSFQLVWQFIMGLGAVGLVTLTKPRTEAGKSIEERNETSGHRHQLNQPRHV